MRLLISYLMLVWISTASAQENTQTSIPISLRECYNSSDIVVKDYKLPMSMNVLINLIRKVENDPSTPVDLQFMVASLIHRFRQDGIEKAHGMAIQPENVLPFSPRGRQFNKFKIILSDLVPGDARRFPNETLNRIERCSLHSMLSDSIEFKQRGDEGNVCGRLAKFQMRASRSLKEEVEVLDIDSIKSKSKRGMLLKASSTKPNPNTDIDLIPQNRGLNDKLQYPRSECPVENGVIFTKWGAVSAGNLLAGIAAGAAPEDIPLSELKVSSQSVTSLNNIWGSTLAGDLAEAALYESTKGIDIGASGGWNSTQVPRWYFLTKNTNTYMTDAEIRGGLDGLILGTNIATIRNKVSSIKLSQVLDMYYSEKGVLSAETKACKRRDLYKKYAPSNQIQQQTTAFGIVFNNRVTLEVTLMEDDIIKYAKSYADALDKYIPSMNDLACVRDQDYQQISTDLIIALDFQWPYDQIYPTLSYLLDNIDINQYNSNYTLINAKDGSVVVNSTSNIVDFHEVFNQSMYNQPLAKGFDISKAVRAIEDIAREKMEAERRLQQAGGRSLLGLLVTSVTAIDEKDKNYVVQRLNDVVKVQLPDLKFLVLTAGSKDSFNNIVQDTSRDVFPISPSSDGMFIMQAVTPLISRIKEVPIRMINSRCGSDWSSRDNDKPLVQYVATKSINYYKMSPNYFFGDGSKNVKIKGQGFGVLTVCHSRSNSLPRGNNSRAGGDSTCKQINTDEYTISLSDPCSGHDYIKDCPPLYMSVEATQSGESSDRYSCLEEDCRYPDDIKYIISLENMGCFSSASNLLINSLLIVLCITILRYLNYA